MKAWEKELRKIEARDGVLKPEAVVRFARNRKTALHKRFTWDDSKAAEAYRLWQARELISVAVLYLPHTDEPVRAFVSLNQDRAKDGGGYRSLTAVLSNRTLRGQLLRESLAELERWQQRYQALKELAPIFTASARVRKALEAQESVSAAG